MLYPADHRTKLYTVVMSTQAQMASSSSETDSKLQNLKQSGMDFHSRLNEAAG